MDIAHLTRTRPQARARAASGIAWPALLPAAVLLLATLGGCPSPPSPQPLELAVWSEFVPYADVQAELRTLKEFNCQLYVSVRPDLIGPDAAGLGSAEWWRLVVAARDAGVPIRAWLTLPTEDGVWLNIHNVPKFATFAQNLIAQSQLRGIPLDWLIFDVEPDYSFASTLHQSLTGNGGIGAVLESLVRQRDTTKFSAATTEINRMVTSIHAQGVQTMVVTLPWVVDDAADSDADIQSLLGTPVTPIAWDEVSVILYRPAIGDLLGAALSPQFVQLYSEVARQRFGPRVQAAVGNVGPGGLLTPVGYNDPAALAADIDAARRAGLTRVSIYALDGIQAAGGLRHWLQSAAKPVETSTDAGDSGMLSHSLIMLGDWLMDRIEMPTN